MDNISERSLLRVLRYRREREMMMKMNREEIVSLLEDRANRGDSDAMLLLGRCYALGSGVRYDSERAEQLISASSKKGNIEAQTIMELIKSWKKDEKVQLCSLSKSFIQVI